LTKAARTAGIATRRIRTVEVDSEYRIDLEDLSAKIAEDRRAGLRPFLVCASAGTVNCGVVDPLVEIARISEDEDLWFHVDGAYGAVFRFLPELTETLAGIEKADSVALDPHKGLFLPYGSGVLLVQDLADLRRAFETTGAYMPAFQKDAERIDFCEVTPELSRDWRGLHLWLPLKLHGLDAFRRALREKRELALLAYEQLAEEDDVEIPVAPQLSLFAFRQRLTNASIAEENDHNRRLLERINASPRIMLTGTMMKGSFYLRICVLHLRTHRARLEEGVKIIREALAELREDA
jgi:aromatic-L-amino-acid decarboxylase